MQSGHHISALMFGTLVVVAIILAVLLVRFLSRGRNRHPMADQRERNIDEIKRGDPPG